jgi:signal transduction histidine kinase
MQDAAHELRTPLAAMQIQLDSLGGTAGGGSDARRMALAVLALGEHDVIGDAVEQELAEVDGCRTRLGTVVEPVRRRRGARTAYAARRDADPTRLPRRDCRWRERRAEG